MTPYSPIARGWEARRLGKPQSSTGHRHTRPKLGLRTTFGAPDLTTFCNLDTLGLTVTGQHVDAHGVTLECRVAIPDDRCHTCGDRGRSLGTIARKVAHEHFGGRPTTLLVRMRRYRCTLFGRFWAEDLQAGAELRAKIFRGGPAWALRALVGGRHTPAPIR